MATVTPQGDWKSPGVFQYIVANMNGDDQSSPIDGGSLEERAVQVYGTFATAVVTIQARLSTATHWETVNTPTGGEVTFSAAGFAEIEQPALQYRAQNTTTGTASNADLTVVFLMRSG